MQQQSRADPFWDVVNALTTQTHEHPKDSDFLSQMSYRNPDPDAIASLVKAFKPSTGDPLLFSLISKAIDNLRMVQHIRMMHVCRRPRFFSLTLSLSCLLLIPYRHLARPHSKIFPLLSTQRQKRKPSKLL